MNKSFLTKSNIMATATATKIQSPEHKAASEASRKAFTVKELYERKTLGIVDE